jgi:hypothetical protein
MSENHSEHLCKIFCFRFLTGKPIPRRLHPTQDAVEFYTNPETRGYLADPAKVAEHRFELAQKYGYKVQDIDPSDPLMVIC